MATQSVSTNRLPELARYVLRPTLAEARLITDKHACNAAYVEGLAEQLRDVEVKISALENALHLDSPAPDDDLANRPEIERIRCRSTQLSCRLRRIEESLGRH